MVKCLAGVVNEGIEEDKHEEGRQQGFYQEGLEEGQVSQASHLSRITCDTPLKHEHAALQSGDSKH